MFQKNSLKILEVFWKTVKVVGVCHWVEGQTGDISSMSWLTILKHVKKKHHSHQMQVNGNKNVSESDSTIINQCHLNHVKLAICKLELQYHIQDQPVVCDICSTTYDSTTFDSDTVGGKNFGSLP